MDTDTIYTHPTTQQCTIPLATTDTAGLMSPSDKLKLQTLSYNWVELGTKNINLSDSDDDSNRASISYNISSQYGEDFHNSLMVRISLNIFSMRAYASATKANNSTPSASVAFEVCNIILAEDSEYGSTASANISILNEMRTRFLVPTDSGFDVYSNQQLSEKIGTCGINSLSIIVRASTSGGTSSHSQSVSLSADISVYVVR